MVIFRCVVSNSSKQFSGCNGTFISRTYDQSAEFGHTRTARGYHRGFSAFSTFYKLYFHSLQREIQFFQSIFFFPIKFVRRILCLCSTMPLSPLTSKMCFVGVFLVGWGCPKPSIWPASLVKETTASRQLHVLVGNVACRGEKRADQSE